MGEPLFGNRLFEFDKALTSGTTGELDLALAWVKEDCGNAIATEVARELILYLRRPGGQAQLSVSLAAQAK